MKFLALSTLIAAAMALPTARNTCNFKTTHRVPHADPQSAQSWALYTANTERGTIKLSQTEWPFAPDTIVSFPNGPRFLYNINTDPDVQRCEVRADPGNGIPRGNKIEVADKGDYTEYTCYILNVGC